MTVEEGSRTGDGEAVSTRGHSECGGGGAGVSAELKGAFSDELHSTLLTKATQAHTHTLRPIGSFKSVRIIVMKRLLRQEKHAFRSSDSLLACRGDNQRDVAPPSRKLFFQSTKGNEEEDHHLSLII